MTEVITRVVSSDRFRAMGLVPWTELLEKVKEMWSNENNVDVKEISEVVADKKLKPQVSINNHKHLVVRLIPELKVVRIKLNSGDEVSMYKTYTFQDFDVVIVFDAETSKEIYNFIKSVSISFFDDDYY